MPHMKVLVVRAARQGAPLCRVLAPADAAGYSLHPIKRFFGGDRVGVKPGIHTELVRVVDMVQPAKVLNLPFTPDVLQVPTTPGNSTARAVVAMNHPRFLLVLLNGSLHGRRPEGNGAPDGNSTESCCSKEGQSLGSILGNGGAWGRAAWIACLKPSEVVKFFSRQWRTIEGPLLPAPFNARYPGGIRRVAAPGL